MHGSNLEYVSIIELSSRGAAFSLVWMVWDVEPEALRDGRVVCLPFWKNDALMGTCAGRNGYISKRSIFFSYYQRESTSRNRAAKQPAVHEFGRAIEEVEVARLVLTENL